MTPTFCSATSFSVKLKAAKAARIRRLPLVVASVSASGWAVLLAAWTGLVPPCPALATDSSASMSPVLLTQKAQPPEDARRVIQSGGKLTLDIYLHAVDANFPGLSSALDSQHIASANRLEKQGLFDPLLTDESGYTRMQNTSHIGEDKEVLFNYPKIELPFQSGIRAFAQYRYNPDTAESPYIETGLGGELSAGLFVPLLRGLFVNEQAYALKESRLGEQLATQTFILTRLDTLMRAGSTYWNWVGAFQKSQVASQILDLSKLVVNISQRQETAGDLARIYVTEAEEDQQRRDADFTQSQRDFQKHSFTLSSLLFDVGGVPLPLPKDVNVPDTPPRPEPFSETDTEHNVVLALSRRPELLGIDVQRKVAQLQIKLAKNQLLPALNAVITDGYDAGKNGIGDTYRAQLTLSQPLWMRAARGKLEAARLRLDKLDKDRMAEEQRIRNEVYDAISAINLAYRRFLSLEQQVAKAEQVYQGERERFRMGDSTVFLIAERERQLNEAKVRMIDAQVEYHIGILALRAITCQL